MPRGVRAGLAALVLVALAPLPAAGQEAGVASEPSARSVAVEQELSRLANEYEEGSLEEARAVAEFDVSEREQTALDTEVRRLDAALADNTVALQAAETASTQAEAAQRLTAHRLATAKADVVAALDQVRQVAMLSYIGQGQLDLAASVLEDAETAADLGVGLTYAEVVGDVQRERSARLRRDEDQLTGLEAQAEMDQARTVLARSVLAESRTRLQIDRAARGAALEKVAAEVAIQRTLVAQVQAALAAYQSRIDDLRSESAAIAALLRSRSLNTAPAPRPAEAAAATTGPRPTPAPGPPSTAATTRPAAPTRPATPTTARAASTTRPPAAPRPAALTTARAPSTTRPAPRATPTTRRPATTTTQPKASATPTAPVGAAPPQRPALAFPLPGWPIVSGFGMRVHPILGIRRMHEGIDIWGPAGTPIRAAADGVVVWAGPRGGYGNAVILDHGFGLGTVYAHQSAVGVSQGQTVKKGEVIGYVGQTGLAAGPHLHFEVRINGTAYDPLNFVRPG